MRSFFYTVVAYFVLLGIPAYAQNKADLFADLKGNDTLQKLVDIFTAQINKSSHTDFTVRPVSAYNGKGIYINGANAINKLVLPSSKLLTGSSESFSVTANEQTVQITGNSNMAIGHAIFSYLEFLGYRFYFANTDWHIVPAKVVLFRKWTMVSSPSFDCRRVWYGYGTGSKIADDDYNFWVLANKLGGAMNTAYGHAYENIVSHNTEVFLKHPEWFYPVAGKGVLPDGGKFDMSREDLIQLLIQDTKREIENSIKSKTAAYKMISLSPSDGDGTCNSAACQQLGSITDRVYYLVNRVAKAIRQQYPSTLIGCLAYGEYINPPAKKVEPNVFVGITTAFNTSKYSVPQLVDEWRKKGAIPGIYDYFSWYAWDFDIPGQSLASKPDDLVKSIKKYYASGAKAYEGESSIGWVSKGLGYYLAAKQMWDVNTDAAAAKKEFFTLCFGKAAGAMHKLWDEWENYSFISVREGYLARWIDYTAEAEKAERDENVRKRLHQVKSYLHYLFLYRNYKLEKTETNLLALLSFGYRKLDDGSVAGYPAFFEVGNRAGIAGMDYYDKNAKWKVNSRQVTMEEMDQLIRQDRIKLKIAEPVKEFATAQKFSTVPGLERYRKTIDDTAVTDNGFWYTNEWLVEIKNKGTANYIDFTGDYLNDLTNIKPFKISVYPYTASGDIASQPVVMYYEYNKRKVKERISLAQLNAGYYTIIIEDPVKIFQLAFSAAVNFSMVMRPTRQIKCTMLNYAFIYVPEGTPKFNVIKSGTVEFITPTGRKVSLTNNKPEDLQVQVLEGEAGLWRIKPLYDQLLLEGVPPYLGTSPRQMLIPAGIR